MKKILLDPGIIPYSLVKKEVQNFINNENKIDVISDNPLRNNWGELANECDLFSYKIFNKVNSIEKLLSVKDYNLLLNDIINDSRTLLIAERVTHIFLWNSLHNLIQKIEIQLTNAILLLDKTTPDFLMFQATPHNLPSWILGKTAEFLNIPVYMIQTSPLPWRFWLIKGIEKQVPFFPNDIKNEKDNFIDNFIEKTVGSYDKAIPSYERKRIESRKGKYWSWAKEIRDGLKKPRIFLTLFNKHKLYKKYDALSNGFEVSGKNLVLLLHFQPERTSLPEGYIFSQQWLMVKTISQMLPKGVKLYVKEHPSSFTGRFDIRYRNIDFYNNIVALENVELVPLGYDTFNLIDSSEGIITLTGTVGIQSLLRGKKVVALGMASYREAPGVVNLEILNNGYENVFKKNENLQDDVISYLRSIIANSVTGISSDLNADIYAPSTRILGHAELLNRFFQSL